MFTRMNIGSAQYEAASVLGHLISHGWLGHDLPEVTNRLIGFLGGITREEAIRVSLKNEPTHPFNRMMAEVRELARQRRSTITAYGYLKQPVRSASGILIWEPGHYINLMVRPAVIDIPGDRVVTSAIRIYFIVCSVCGNFQVNRFNQLIKREINRLKQGNRTAIMFHYDRPSSAHDRVVCRCGLDAP
jgi:hypothetical protein